MYELTSRRVELERIEDEKMTIHEALDRCLEEIHSGGATVEECLAEYPQYARELAPLLRTASRLESTDGVRPTRAFKSRLRKQLTGDVAKPGRGFFSLHSLVFWTLIILLVAGFAVWMSIKFEVAGHASPPVAPVNYWPPSSQMHRRAAHSALSPTEVSFHARQSTSLYSTRNSRPKAARSWRSSRSKTAEMMNVDSRLDGVSCRGDGFEG